MTYLLPVSAVFVLALAIGIGGCARSGPETPGRDAAGGGVKAHVDPETGELRDSPAPGTEPVNAGDVLSPSRVPAAGMKAYVDPDTGELRDSPAPGTAPVPGGDVLPPRAKRDESEE